ncbi:hypothetical protein FB451DRAFT_1254790 [Mycena latifolia]|nr:hypothetical protein FB451DRAFT_1254790 [Mycena latifolia]
MQQSFQVLLCLALSCAAAQAVPITETLRSTAVTAEILSAPLQTTTLLPMTTHPVVILCNRAGDTGCPNCVCQ